MENNRLKYEISRSSDFIIETTLDSVGPGFKVTDDPCTKAFHNGEEIGIGNVKSIGLIAQMKDLGVNFSLSCLIKETRRIVSLSLQDIEFIQNESCL